MTAVIIIVIAVIFITACVFYNMKCDDGESHNWGKWKEYEDRDAWGIYSMYQKRSCNNCGLTKKRKV